MSSTNKTAHLALNQWVGTDPFRMTDFNEDNEKLDAAISELQTGALRVLKGSYIGTGSHGETNPCTLTFESVPKLVIISCSTSSAVFFAESCCCFSFHTNSSSVSTINHRWNGTTLSWSNVTAPQYQLNQKNVEYHWLAFI